MTEQTVWQAPEGQVGPAPGVRFADYGPRLVAYIIDGLLVGAFVIVVMLAWALLSLASGGFRDDTLSPGAGAGLAVMMVVLLVGGLGYFPWFWARDGATPGMKMMGLLLVRDADGGPVTGGQAIIRLVGYAVSGILYLGYIWVFIDKRRRGWHDLIAGTLMIARP
jgi:uncharacterized RDD family membrane protein YckC